jgi:hypothetical protein
MTKLRGGFDTEDVRLDRLPEFDPRSRNFAAVDIAPSTELVSKSWPLRWGLDQGEEGACTNFALAHNRLGSPAPRKLGPDVPTVEALARRLYRRSKQLDSWPGEEYEGTSQLAAAKAWREAGLLGSFRWAFGIDDLLITVAQLGSVVLATDWLSDMHDPDRSGLLDVSGAFVGGHAYDCTGLILHPERSSIWKATGVRGEPLLFGPNSWGPRRQPDGPTIGRPWGRGGYWAMRASDVERLLAGIKYPGEALLPLDR